MSDPFQDNDERFGPEKKTGSRKAWLGAIAVLSLFAISDVIEYRELAAEGVDRDKLEELERAVEEMETFSSWVTVSCKKVFQQGQSFIIFGRVWGGTLMSVEHHSGGLKSAVREKGLSGVLISLG